jgi:hypothetical protein
MSPSTNHRMRHSVQCHLCRLPIPGFHRLPQGGTSRTTSPSPTAAQFDFRAQFDFLNLTCKPHNTSNNVNVNVNINLNPDANHTPCTTSGAKYSKPWPPDTFLQFHLGVTQMAPIPQHESPHYALDAMDDAFAGSVHHGDPLEPIIFALQLGCPLQLHAIAAVLPHVLLLANIKDDNLIGPAQGQ